MLIDPSYAHPSPGRILQSSNLSPEISEGIELLQEQIQYTLLRSIWDRLHLDEDSGENWFEEWSQVAFKPSPHLLGLLTDFYESKEERQPEGRLRVAFEVPRHSPVALTDSRGDEEKKRLERQLRAVFEIDPFEDGMFHPAEEIIAKALREENACLTLERLKEFSLDKAHPSFAASVLRCLGRCEQLGDAEWRKGMVRDALAMENVQIRDAGVHAAEAWADSGMGEILDAHDEPQPWLRDYIQDVAKDLAE